MGEIAEGLLDGTFDSITGEYIGEGCGYPRTMYKHFSKKQGKGKYDSLIKEFPNLKIKDLGQGVNIYFEDIRIGVLTVWFRHQKYCFSTQNIWRYYTDYPELLAIIYEKLNPSSKAVSINQYTQISDAVQKCIDHINKKAELIGTHKGADHATATMLKNIAYELEQYK